MARWWVFPPRARLRLFYRRDGDEIHYVVRSLGINPGLNPAIWSQEDLPGTWTAPGPRPPVPANRWRDLGGRIEELTGGEVGRRYRLRPCPDTARPIGINQRGEEVREHDGRRWIIQAGTDNSRSWAGDELAHPPARALRFGSRQAWTQLARFLVDLASRGQLSLDEDELTGLATAAVDSGRRPSFRAWTRDPAESRRILLSELRAALLAPAAEAARPQWVEAVTLERAIPALSRADGPDPSLTVAAAVAGIAGPLREACLAGAESGSAWAELFGRGRAQNALVDSRRMEPSAAAALLVEQSDSRPGRVVSLLPGDPDQPDIQHALTSVARRRGIEAILHLPAEAVPDEPDGLTLVAAGLRRPRELAEPPPQALRVIRGEVRGDLRRWLDEGMRGRGRLAGEEEAATRQTPYVPISRIGQAKCTIARCHQTAANLAGRNLTGRRGPVDEFVAGLLGTGRDVLEARYSPEQIDAIAMSEDAHLRGRAFLLADQTGTGKGRAAVGMAASWLRSDPVNRVIYVTVGNAAADVIRDLRNTGVIDETGRPILLGNMPNLPDAHTPSEGERREIQDSRAFPQGARFIVTSWSSIQLGAAGDPARSAAERRGAEWFAAVAGDPSTMVILDEAHCALNPSSNLGISARRAMAGAGRVTFVTATALRSPEGVDLYRRLMPGWMGDREFDRIVGALRSSGETAQESFISMLTEDGVMLRRDHDTGMVPYTVDTPDGAEAGRAAAVMASVSEVAERLMAVAQAVRRWCDDAQAPYRARAVAGGREGDRAARQLETMLTGGFGGPMDQIARSVLVALKVDQASRRAVLELRERGRKPMIAISSTNGEFLRRIHNGEVALPAGRPPDLRDLIRHVAARVCMIKGLQDGMVLGGIRVEAAELDLRAHDAAVGRLWEELSDAVEAIPAGQPLSPADALAAALRAEGVSSGEITGREYRLTAAGQVERREVPRKETIAERYNSGDIDVLIYNEAGGTGASYHASAEFPDQRPRTILQLELPLDVLRHLQSMGRGNRFDQVALPQFITLSTDTLAEQRLLAINNRKLRTVGAILDGDRNHPALAADVPDLFNLIGERACAEVIRSDQVLAARLDLHEGSRNLAKSIFTRALLLSETEQTRLFGLITAEYEAQLAEADARGQNPLKVPSLPGYVEILSTMPYAAGHADVAAEGGDSVFSREMTLSTGVWRMPPGLPASAVSAATVEASGGPGLGGAAAAQAAARDLTARWQAVTAAGMQEDELRNLIDLLQAFEPGRVLRPTDDPEEFMVAVEYLPPGQFLSDRSFGHRFRCIQPGDTEIRTWSAAQLMKEGFFPRRQNILDDDAWVATRFDHFAAAGNRRAVQILSGDMLSVASAVTGYGSRRYRVCTFNDQTGMTRRAAVNCDVRKLDLTKLPFRITAASLLDAVSDQVSGRADRQLLRSPASAEQEAKDARTRTESTYRPWLMNLRLKLEHHPVLHMSLPSLSVRNMQAFWTVGTGPELYRSVTGDALRKPAGTAEARTRVTVELNCTDGDDMRRAERICALIDRHPASDLFAPGHMREWWRERGRGRAGARQPRLEAATFGQLADSVDRAGTGPHPGVAARVNCPDGEIIVHSLPDADPERCGSIVTLPPAGGKAGNLWSGREGQELFRTVFGKSPAKAGSGGPSMQRSVFLDRKQTRRMCSLLQRKARGTAGWSVDIAHDGRAPEAEPAAGIAA